MLKRSQTIIKKLNLSDSAMVNNFAIFCFLLLAICTAVFNLIEAINGNISFFNFSVNLVLFFCPVLISFMLYKRDKTSNLIMHFLSIGFSVFYTYALFTSPIQYTFLYALPALVIVLVYNDVKLSAKCAIGVVIENIIYVILHTLSNDITKADLPNSILRIMILTFFVVFIVFASSLNIRLNQNKLDRINKEKEKTSKLLNHIVGVSSEMTDDISKVSEQMKRLDEAVFETCSSMKEVSAGTVNTTQSVQTQLLKTEEIQKYVENVDNVSSSITSTMKIAQNEINIGKDNIDNLIKQVNDSEIASSQVSSKLSTLEESASNMQSIIELISNVTKQTSLLALNASIESARAGEAGKSKMSKNW